MCGRFSLTLPIKDLLEFLDAEAERILKPRYNIAPTQEILILRAGPGGGKHLAPARWGLIPPWADSISTGSPLINARCETVATKPSFRKAFRSRRCLIPATGFYEWKREGRNRLPYHITYADKGPMLLAGVWERWQNSEESNQVVDSCAIITTEACSKIHPLHNRMPVLVPASALDLWLRGSPEQVSPLMSSYDCDDLLLSPANPAMNSPNVEGPECLEATEKE